MKGASGGAGGAPSASKLPPPARVLQSVMHLRALATVAALGVALALPGVAGAEIIEVGRTSQAATPTCPANCLAVSRTTGYQSKIGGPNGGFMIIPHDGRIVAWSIALGDPSKSQIDFFDKNLGGSASAQITILQPGKQWNQRVVAQGEPQGLAPYFGTTPQFALARSIPVKAGWLVALTVPTWAPALAANVGPHIEWRASRGKGRCHDTQAQTAQTGLTTAPFSCVYQARLTYSATLVTTPKPKPATTPRQKKKRNNK